ncbi:MAG: response regulator [Candidatus Omnitrophica bacterium]|nr:response regulator [Candidatus Omnitrophota bacterium]MDD5430013.1 response regulator [Candidatus Omnitrophota bacterium]
MVKKVLIVDDEQEVVDFLEKGLKREGFEVICALDGLEAKGKISQEDPDVIILDLLMPKLDGWGVLNWLRKDAKLTIPTIIVSAKGDLEDMQKSYKLDADTYLIKPVNIKDVLNAIRMLFSLNQSEDN